MIKKIILLVSIVAIITGGIFYWAKSQVEPPSIPEKTNLHKKDIETRIRQFTSIATNTDQFSTYQPSHLQISQEFDDLLDRINVFEKEDKLSQPQVQDFNSQVADVYAQHLIDYSLKTFSMKGWWNEATLSDIVSETKRTLSYHPKTKVGELNTVLGIIEDYHAAKKLAYKKQYSNLDQAKKDIAQADKYRNDEFLSNCTDLTKALGNVRANIAEAHYKWIESRIEDLSSIVDEIEASKVLDEKVLHCTAWENFALRVKKDFQEYKDNVNSVYGNEAANKYKANDLYEKFRDIQRRHSILNCPK